jgi:hypothetical protein
MDLFADPDTAQASMIQNLASLPAVVRTFQEGGDASGEPTFAQEDPTTVSFEAL